MNILNYLHVLCLSFAWLSMWQVSIDMTPCSKLSSRIPYYFA